MGKINATKPTLLNQIGKAYYFSFSSGHIGGDVVVFAKSKKKAVILANEAMFSEALNKQKEPLTEKDLTEVKLGTCVIINDGDY